MRTAMGAVELEGFGMLRGTSHSSGSRMAPAASCMTAVITKLTPKPQRAIRKPPKAADPDHENTNNESRLFHRARALCIRINTTQQSHRFYCHRVVTRHVLLQCGPAPALRQEVTSCSERLLVQCHTLNGLKRWCSKLVWENDERGQGEGTLGTKSMRIDFWRA